VWFYFVKDTTQQIKILHKPAENWMDAQTEQTKQESRKQNSN
jgi:flagellar biogenesis protein FliO